MATSAWSPGFLAPQRGLGDERVDLAHARAEVVHARTHRAGNEFTNAVEFNQATDFTTDEAIQVEIDRAARTRTQGIGGLEQELVFEQGVQPFPAGQSHGFECGSAENGGYCGAADLKRARSCAA
ncbi:hypothetical protein QTI66_00650 [Variovorax sp. J22R133]|uniref:hypothetical protein n=1 Tax=Variovorax brevis TaxID=3053503 RepID=UPI002577AC8A|nr:hypothetical protein [Variovorax sp. J22R133]MDM0110634.1 hypothetical protein [Variovorax sp. J22R133]